MNRREVSAGEFFLADLRYIIRLSISLRWGIAGFLLTLPFLLKWSGLFVRPMPVLLTAAGVVVYNLIFLIIVRFFVGTSARDNSFRVYRNIGKMQIILDYVSLALTLYFVGGLHTNLFFILIFHVVIGSILLESRYMYFMVFVSVAGFFAVSLLELHKAIPYYNLYGLICDLTVRNIIIESIIHLGICISVVFLVSLLTTRIRSDNSKLLSTNLQLAESLESMRSLEARKSKFMRYSAHQLRSPLATIIASMNVISKKLIPIESERAFNILVGGLNRAKSLLSLVNDLLELARIRDEVRRLKKEETVNLSVMLEEIIFSLGERIRQSSKKVERSYCGVKDESEYVENFQDRNSFNKHLAEIIPIILHGVSSHHLRHALYNLVENAVKYSHDGGIITVKTECQENGSIRVFVCDTGIGIDKNFIEDIFFEFVRSPNAKDHQTEGTGLGLSIVKEILDDHGAIISVESEKDEGTAFTIVFPPKNK